MLRRFLTLAAAAALLGGLALLVSRRADRVESSEPLKAFAPESLFRVELERQGAAGVAFEKKAGLWRTTSPVEDAADDAACSELIAALSQLKIGSELSSDSGAYGAYGLSESSATHVKVFSRDRAVPALDGYFGARALGEQTLYFRRAREKPVYLAEGVAQSLLNRPAGAYLERAFFSEKLGPIQSVAMSAGGKTIALEKGSPAWTAAVHLRVADFIVEKKGSEETGLDHPILIVEAVGSARSARWLIGKPSSANGEKGAYRYARCDDRPGVLALVAMSDTEPLIKALKP